ncbi:MAG: hypothetical protein WC364_10200 [Eubacteriales bacterium]|jgi:hypothetical protein
MATLIYTRTTCAICKIPFKTHPRCCSCGIYTGKGHIEINLNNYKGHKICDSCLKRWKGIEKQVKKDVDFGAFLSSKILDNED